MAPEALDGRINLEEMTSFKHMDVYAMALVLWEIVSGMRSPNGTRGKRIFTIFSSLSFLERKLMLPYEDLVGKRPTIDAMREVVLRHQERPRIPDEWRQNKVRKEKKKEIALYRTWRNPTAFRFRTPVQVRCSKRRVT